MPSFITSFLACCLLSASKPLLQKVYCRKLERLIKTTHGSKQYSLSSWCGRAIVCRNHLMADREHSTGDNEIKSQFRLSWDQRKWIYFIWGNFEIFSNILGCHNESRLPFPAWLFSLTSSSFLIFSPSLEWPMLSIGIIRQTIGRTACMKLHKLMLPG